MLRISLMRPSLKSLTNSLLGVGKFLALGFDIGVAELYTGTLAP